MQVEVTYGAWTARARPGSPRAYTVEIRKGGVTVSHGWWRRYPRGHFFRFTPSVSRENLPVEAYLALEGLVTDALAPRDGVTLEGCQNGSGRP